MNDSPTSPPQRPPFIPSQRIFRLTAPWDERKAWLRPERFRRLKRKHGGDADDRPSELGKPKADASPFWWEEVDDRGDFLTGDAWKRLVVCDNAGMGKTKSLAQIAHWRPAKDPDQLTLLVEFADLPGDFRGYLQSWDGMPPLLLRSLLVGCGAVDNENPALEQQLRSLVKRKMRQGKCTLLVDALDQSNTHKHPENAAKALAEFLSAHPNVRCVVSGRPFAVNHYWSKLIATTGPWELIQLDPFTEDERRRFLGKTRADKLNRVDADVLAIPRALETIFNTPASELDGVRTAADTYWRCVHAMLEKAKELQRIKISLPQAQKLFALVAFEMVQRGIFAGVDGNPQGITEREMDEFVRAVWKRRKAHFREGDDYRNRKKFEADLGRLNALNVMIDPGVLNVPHGANPNAPQLTQLVWRNRTLQDFFAALWITRYADQDDHRWLHKRLYVRGEEEEKNKPTTQHAELEEFWRLAAEMPQAAFADLTYVRAMKGLYCPHKKPRKTIRSTEMIFRSLPTMLRLAGYLTTDDWYEPDLFLSNEPGRASPIEAVQRAGRKLAKSGKYAALLKKVTAEEKPKKKLKSPSSANDLARDALLLFFGEFPAIAHGLRVSDDKEARKVAQDFGSWFVDVPNETSQSLDFWMGDAESVYDDEPLHESSVDRGFRLCKYALTNGVYALFDAQHRARFGDYKEYSIDPRDPVIYVNFYDAICVCLWLGGRLPDEYEWEYAARAQPGRVNPPTKWCFGNKEEDLAKYAWYDENSAEGTADGKQRTHPVGTRQANAFGLYDLHGNVWEWTSSWQDEDPRKGRERTFVSSSRVSRGGSFSSSAGITRSAFRIRVVPTDTDYLGGVRVARARKS